MLEGLAAWVLNTYVGEYVENLNTTQLSIALLQGFVELENLPLKKDALKSLDIPIEVKSGFIGKITLHIPLRRLRSEPWVISIEKLYLVAGPLTHLQYDAEKERKNEQEQKKAMLDALEEKWKINQGSQQDQSASWFSYGTSMAANILENIQLKVKDVHIRYEDDKMNPSCPFACGVIIKNLSVQSTDATWASKFVSHNEEDVMFKLVDLKDFGIYCDTNVTMVGDLPMSDLADVLEREMYLSTSGKFQQHEYILQPITAQGKVNRNTSAMPLRSATSPRIFVELTLGDMSFSLSTEQYQFYNLWQKEFARHGKQRKFRKERPNCSVSSSPRKWWHFAQEVHLAKIQDRNDRLTKKFILDRAHLVAVYARIYTAYLKGETLTVQQKSTKTSIEEELEFDELKLIREATFFKVKKNSQVVYNLAAKKSPPPSETSATQPKESGSLFQHWFPGWSGWTQSTVTQQPVTTPSPTDLGSVDVAPSSSSSQETSASVTPLSEDDVVTEDEIEQEIQDVIKDSSENSSFLRKDTVFARMAFLLKKGSFQLKEKHISDKAEAQSHSLVELHCSTIEMQFESRPRTSAMKFSLAVGSLYVQDQTAKNPTFTYIICPQVKDPLCRTAFNPVSQFVNPQNISLLARDSEGMEFFKLSYEKNPTAVFKYSVSIKTQPLDIIYTPELMRKLKDFFSTPATGLSRTASSVYSWQFDKFRKQTQEELRNTLDQLLEGKASKWNINLDISAPKLIIPESVLDQNPQLVVIDLGNFRVNTVTSQSDISDQLKQKAKLREDDGEDKFETPLSTPPNETEEDEEVKKTMAGGVFSSLKKPKSSESLSEDSAENMFQDRLYEKYRIGLTEVQVLLGRLNDNWKHAYAKGTSLMHVVDRFNISVMLERRLITTSDIQWPTAKLSGNLPTLTFHLNERKIQSLQKCFDTFSEPRPVGLSQSATYQQSSSSSFDVPLSNTLQEQSSFDLPSPVLVSSKELVEDNKMVVLQFLINNLSLEVQSQGQALIELQVTGVQADVHLKPLNKSLVLTVHSLLLVDALQTYGRDFELLVASHKNVILDSRSGSIKGSEFNSPSSPQSPSSPASPGSPSPDLPTSISFSSFQSIQDAISNAFHSVLPQAPTQQNRKSAETDAGHQFPPSDAKALIMLEYEVFTKPAPVSLDCQTGEIVTTLLNLQFNSLDFIANQETLTEIMGFVNRTFPKKSSSESVNTPAANSNVDNTGHSKVKDVVHVNADFKRLNVMMVKFLSWDSHKIARKVATATVSSAKLQVKYDEKWDLEGSLGGLHLLDVTPDGTLYQQVVSIGQFQEVDPSSGLAVSAGGVSFTIPTSPIPEMYQTAMDDKIFSEYSLRSSQPRKNACTFFIRRRQPVHPQETDNSMLDVPTSDHEPLEAQFDMAALTYVHCPKFLEQLLDCASEFRDYMTKVAASIKTAATEVAMGIVGVRGDKDGSATDASLAGYAIRRDQSLGDITNTILLEDISQQQGSPSVKVNKLMILINARMESPILVIPRTPNSPQVLLAHLGEIVIDNSSMMNVPSESGRGHFRGQNQDLITLSLTNMNLYSLHLGQQVTVTTTGLNSSKLSELTQKFGVPILYDTSVDLTIGKRELDNPFINPDVSSGIEGMMGLGGASSRKQRSDSDAKFEDELSVSSLLDIKANISSPIKLSLSKEVYEQILQTVDNLTYDAESAKQPNQSPSSPQNHAAMGKPERSQAFTYTPSSKSQDRPAADGKKQEMQSNQGAHSFPDEPGSGGSFLAKHVEFDVPLFEIELRGDFGDGERGLVDLKLYDFSVQYEKNDRACTRINLHLKSLQMDDLLEPVDSKHRQIIVSRPSKSKDVLEHLHSQPKALMSKSCPDSTIVAPIPRMPPSLPSSFIDRGQTKEQQCHQNTSHQRRRPASSESECPYTPPPSPAAREPIVTQQRRPDDLVHIDVTLVDKKRPEYVTKYNKTNRFINIDFACLDATINLQTWVVLLDFLGLGAKVHGVKVAGEGTSQATEQQVDINSQGDKDDVNSDINFQVESFTLIFNKPDYELAQATAANLRMHMVMRDGDLKASGQLGSLSLLDQSPNGQLYRQRFVSTGRQVVEFNFFKYGLPDLDLQRAFDISLSLRMSSVRYIHTNRFQAEMVAFAQHFLQLQDLLGRQRAASIGKKINETATRASRILLDIEAVSPILLIPHSSKTNAVLVADLGNLKLTNHFIVDGQPGTLRAKREADQSKTSAHQSTAGTSAALQKGIVHRSMADNMVNEAHRPARPIDPMTQSVYGSFDADERFEGFDPTGFGVPSSQPKAQPSMKRNFSQSYPNQRHTVGEGGEDGDDHRCLLDVISVTLSEMDLFTAKRICKSDYQGGDLSTDMEFSTFVLEREHGKLLKEKCQLELHIERNLEGDVSHTAPDFCINGKLSSVDCHLDIGQYELIRGILNHNLGERLEEFQRPLMSHLQDPRIQTVLGGKPWKGISLIIDLRNVTVELLHSHKLGPDVPERSLSRLDFIRSQLSVSSYSNQLKEVDLVSNEIKIYDTRFKFEPVNARPNVFTSILQPSSGSKERKGLQMEMHLRLAPDSSHFTLLLNNVRLMCVFDWLLAMKEYISREPPNPFAKAGQQPPQSPLPPDPVNEPMPFKAHRNQSPLTVSRGIVTRRGPMVEEVKVPFEMVMNFTDTQFVVVEDSTSLDTNAVILKSTAVIIYKPQCHERILSCSLQNVELFSCCLMAEDDTALSIIDPTTLTIELNANPLPQHDPSATGLLGLKDAQRRHLVLEVVLKPLNIRVSYHDIVMFLAILNSLPQQALQAQQQQATANSASTESTPHQPPPPPAASAGQVNIGAEDNMTKSMLVDPFSSHNRQEDKEEEVLRLLDLGFPESDVRRALAASSWDLDKAALWLTENGKHMSPKKAAEPAPSSASFGQDLLTDIELNAESIVLCLIDDCGDADIPLAEISCNNLDIQQKLEPCVEGKAQFQLMAEYYNRKLSGWEPCLEPWKCLAEWRQYSKPEKKLTLQVSVKEMININVTSTLIDLYKQTSDNWAEDYLRQHGDKTRHSRQPSGTSGSAQHAAPTQSQHKRLPFIPYMIRNDTGCPLWFLTATNTPSNLANEGNAQMMDSAYIQATDWKRVGPGESRPINFHGREKLRHQKSHAMHVNQLFVKIEGWNRLTAVSVDKVGVYFRHADPDHRAPPNLSPARVVFEVKQEGSARKLIIVRSALVIHNRLDSPVELKLESTDESGHYQCMSVPINTALPVPLHYINMRIRARPCDLPVHFCKKPLDWQHVKTSGDKPDGIRTCEILGPEKSEYRFFVCVTRQKFPEAHMSASSTSQNLSHGYITPTLPGHILTLLPPLSICNLLPLELHYYLKGTGVSGNLKAGKQAALHGVDVSQSFDLGIHLENFPQCKELTVPPNVSNHKKVLLRIFDSQNRLLKLLVRISMLKRGSIMLTISSQFWLVNKTGLPLVFKQDGCKAIAAGQFEEHEQARSVTPLLFSFADVEEVNLCQMRLGTSVHGPSARPQWSTRFSLDGGTIKKALHVIQHDASRPDWVYNIGIQVTPGRGRYRGTNIVTFAPHFILDNQSEFKLAIAQKFMTSKEAPQQNCLIAFPQSSLPFHWPRVDLDQLLCVKILDIDHCRWSGGFNIDKINSFHINMRDLNGICHLLKVEVVQQGPTFFIVFANADVMPPPFRIDNLSDVPVLYYQSDTEDKLKTFIQPRSSIPYAWDEPTLKPLKLTLSILGGTTGSYTLDKLQEGEQLHYENFIYLAATATFDRSWPEHVSELVLDCVHNNNIVFKKKEKSKRSQLWRMTGSGMLEHEGSMPPRTPGSPNANTEPGLVLDIADLAPRPGHPVPLILRKPDVRRRSTQTWRFTEHGQLCCHAGSMCVQGIGGIKGVQDGAIVVLGPGPDPDQKDKKPDQTEAANGSNIPPHMLISRQKLRPGSGCVSVRVSMDGPIRVIELVDIQHRQVVKRMTMEEDLEDWEVYDEVKRQMVTKTSTKGNSNTINLAINLTAGIGISLVNNFSEELLYLTLKNISLDIVSRPSAIEFDANVAVIQADNQMWGAQRPVVLFVTPLSRRDVMDSTPALHISAHKVPSATWKAEIFKHLFVSTKRMTLHLEEQLLWKLLQLAGVGKDDRTLHRLDETYDTHRALSAVTAIQSTRYYFGTLKLGINRVTLSMVTSNKLTPDLKTIKNVMSTRLIAFEQANIDMNSFEQYHVFETGPFLLNEIMNHYREELKSQAAKILGSIDFLGNPLGLVNDISEGIAGFVTDGNVGGLLRNVTHGVSNSTAKVVSSLSDGISTVGFDEEHNNKREALRNVTSGSSSDHLMAGFKGFGHGLLGGMTSLVSQSISGAQSEGLGGLFKGMGKGMIGTVTKPVSGVLDLTSGFANALRDSSSRTSHRSPGRTRPPRCTQGTAGLLPLYSEQQAEAQTVLYELNENDYTEYLIAIEQLTSDQRSGEGNFALISSRQVFILNKRKAKPENVVLNIQHAEILNCSHITSEDNKFYVVLTRKTSSGSDVSGTSLNKPQVRCDKKTVAKKVSQEIKYATNLFDERAQTLANDDSSDEDDDW